MESDVLKFIETRRDEIISNLKELIKAKTENPPGDVTQGIEVIARILDEYHVDYRIVEPVKGKQNLIAVIGDESEKTLILNGHVDVVPAGEKWTYDPFGGKIEGNKIILSFDYADGLKTRDGKPPSHFEIAGKDRKFYPARAEIKNNTIIVSSDKVKNPVAVRYGWSDTAEPNLCNGAGLPSSSFRTDNWQ